MSKRMQQLEDIVSYAIDRLNEFRRSAGLFEDIDGTTNTRELGDAIKDLHITYNIVRQDRDNMLLEGGESAEDLANRFGIQNYHTEHENSEVILLGGKRVSEDD